MDLLALGVTTGIVMASLASGCAFSIETSGNGGYGGSASVVVGSSTGMSSSSSSGYNGTGGSGGHGVAARCAVDSDCAMGLTCLVDTADDPIFGGGPVNGFCTRSCDADTDCAEQGATCFKLDDAQPGRCTLSCTIGPPIESIDGFFDTLPADKCLGREDLRCGKAKNGVGVCLPTCGEDAQCKNGRFCDPRLAVCVKDPSEGLPLGAACKAGEEPSTCSGLCVGFDSGVAMCSSPCVLGGDKVSTADCGGPSHGFCAFRAQPNGAGDVGYCTPSCEAHDQCPSPSFWCFAFSGLTEIVGKGYCFAATPCPNGQDDCVNAGTGADTCTTTAYGAYCLDQTFPFSTNGTGGGGGGGAGGADGGTGSTGGGWP
ncbi:BNR repeat domain protein [Minicystis rosea]|nr:BNR repeat domain protein [Minicystis rosea]